MRILSKKETIALYPQAQDLGQFALLLKKLRIGRVMEVKKGEWTRKSSPLQAAWYHKAKHGLVPMENRYKQQKRGDTWYLRRIK